MEVHQLRYFVAVADEGSFTQAARREHVSQSGVSAQVKQLERELGQPLFDRTDRMVTLTDAGTAALPHARDALAALDALRGATDEVAGLLRGAVKVGMVTGCAMPWFFDGLEAVHRAHPQLSVTLIEGPSDELQRELVAGRLDLALVGYAGAPAAGLDVEVVVDDPLVVAVAADHRWARRRAVDLADLADERIVCLSEGTGIRLAFDRAVATHGLDVTVTLEASSPDVVLALAARGLGVAVVARSMARSSGLHAVRIDAPEARSQLGLVWRVTTSASVARRAVIEALTDALAASRRPARAHSA
jgi:DNA-binding transcriptional LysR family regulator